MLVAIPSLQQQKYMYVSIDKFFMLSNWCSLLLLPFNEMHKLSILECTFVTTVPAFIGQVGREEVVTRPCGEGCALTAARESPGWFGVFFFFPLVCSNSIGSECIPHASHYAPSKEEMHDWPRYSPEFIPVCP